MSTVTIDQALLRAKAHQQAGELPQAEALYRQILAVQPNHPDALHLLGVLAGQVGRPDAAIDLIRQAISANPAQAAYHTNLGDAYRALSRLDEALACYRHALALQPASPEALYGVGLVLHGRQELEAAIAHYQKALALQPGFAAGHSHLGTAFYQRGRYAEATACYRRALEINSTDAEAYYNLGVTLADQGQFQEAILCFRKALEFTPNDREAWNNLGAALFNSGGLDEAVVACRRALALQPDYVEPYNNLGNIFKDQGCLEEALAAYREAIRLNPNKPAWLSHLLFALNYAPNVTAQEMYAEQKNWNQRFAVPLRPAIRPHPNVPDPSRRLKIGYVGADFYAHACGHFLVSLLAAHDHAQVEVHCYAGVRRPDHVTQQLKQGADVWRDVLRLSDDELAEQVRKDEIDILVDLAMHTGDNRLPLFARKPAPVQASWLAYPGTTGLETIDYRLTDAFLEPPQAPETGSSEQALCLPNSFWCYDPLTEEPAVNSLPALGGQTLTFGCLNNFCKINSQVLDLWARALDEAPESRLLLLAYPGSHRERVREQLQTLGIAGQRVQFVGRCERREYLALYHQVDLVLDTFPYNGHTTTCDALWMGVPVVTLAGQTAVGRGGVSILSNIGLPELVAHSEDEYVKIAVELAQDLPRLSDLRATLRARMQVSPLMDGPRFAQGVEAAYRQMWTNWCHQKRGETA